MVRAVSVARCRRARVRRLQELDQFGLVPRQQLRGGLAERALAGAEPQIGTIDPELDAAIAQIAQQLQRRHMTPSSQSPDACGVSSKSSDMSVQQLLPILQLQQAAHPRKVEPAYGAKAETVTPRRSLDGVRHGARLEQAEAPGEVAVDGFDGSGLVDEKQGEARLFEGRPVGERLMDLSIQFRTQGDRHETMFDRMIVERSRGKTGNSVGLGMQIGLHGIQAARGAIAVFARIAFCHPAELGQQRTKRGERDRFGAKMPHGSPPADPIRQTRWDVRRRPAAAVPSPRGRPGCRGSHDGKRPSPQGPGSGQNCVAVDTAAGRADFGCDGVVLLIALGKRCGGGVAQELLKRRSEVELLLQSSDDAHQIHRGGAQTEQVLAGIDRRQRQFLRNQSRDARERIGLLLASVRVGRSAAARPKAVPCG